MRSTRENRFNRTISENPGPAEQEFFRIVAEDEGDQERAERTAGKALDAELIDKSKAKFAAEWTKDAFEARKARWNASSLPVPAREKALGISYSDLLFAKKLHG